MAPSDGPSTPFEYDADQPPSLAVVEAVATLGGVDPRELDYTLYDHIQPQALDTLIRSGNAAVTFTFAQYTVHVDEAGTVRITH